MSGIDDLFGGTKERETHPDALFWSDLRERDDIAKVELEFRRKRDGITFRPAEFRATFFDENGKRQDSRKSTWELELHQDLVRAGFRCRSESNDAERFGFSLKSLFEPVEARYGDGYFNAVLIEYLRSTGIDQRPEAKDVFNAIHWDRPSMEGPSFAECRDRIARVLQGVAHDLSTSLGYERPEAEHILASAIAYYVDERFSVTNRRLLGFG